jgi:hypothetical protein
VVEFKEALGLVRELAERDPDNGKPLEGFALFWPRFRSGFLTALVAAVLALAYKILSPVFLKN